MTENADLFDARIPGPLAWRMRPSSLEEIVGQERALRPGSPLRRALMSKTPVSVILWGPPGTGKTTLARMLSRPDRHFQVISAAEVGVKEVRDAIDAARRALALESKFTTLFVDEIHRFSKAQQDSLLGAVENGTITLVAATTENPSVSVIKPLLSRTIVVKLDPLKDEDIKELLRRAASAERGLKGEYEIAPEVFDFIAKSSFGDARRALTVLESAASSSPGKITLDDARAAQGDNATSYDLDGKEHYENVSALIKSIRGSDVDAALHYLSSMIAGGEDPRFISRRLMIAASEDVGTADSNALNVAVSAAQAVEMVGMPEAALFLSHATVYLAMAPKSNAVANAFTRATSNAAKGPYKIPENIAWHNADSYISPHSSPDGVIAQNYRPVELKEVSYYSPKNVGLEARFKERLQWLRKKLALKQLSDD